MANIIEKFANSQIANFFKNQQELFKNCICKKYDYDYDLVGYEEISIELRSNQFIYFYINENKIVLEDFYENDSELTSSEKK